MNTTCLFCKIINKEIPSSIILENESLIIFKDINPKDKTHLLIVPKNHCQNITDLELEPSKLMQIFEAIQALGTMLEENHYKLQVNNGSKSGQEIFHLHFHFISSSKLKSTGFS